MALAWRDHGSAASMSLASQALAGLCRQAGRGIRGYAASPAAPQADTGGLAGIVADAAARVPLARALAGRGALPAEPRDPAAR